MKGKQIVMILAAVSATVSSLAQVPESRRDTFPRPIPEMLSPDLFIPRDRLRGLQPWIAAPLLRPVVHVMTVTGTRDVVGFGEYDQVSPEHFFSTLTGSSLINLPQLFISEQMMVGNTLKIGKKFYFLSGILYGAQLGTMGNNWGMGTREGFLWNHSELLSVIFWTQYFQSVAVYSPVMFPDISGNGAAIRMPATPEVFSFGAQASFTVGEFIISIGTSVAPVPYQKRRHPEFRYR